MRSLLIEVWLTKKRRELDARPRVNAHQRWSLYPQVPELHKTASCLNQLWRCLYTVTLPRSGEKLVACYDKGPIKLWISAWKQAMTWEKLTGMQALFVHVRFHWKNPGIMKIHENVVAFNKPVHNLQAEGFNYADYVDAIIKWVSSGEVLHKSPHGLWAKMWFA